MPKLFVPMLLLLAAFCFNANAQTKDSTYITTHDSTFKTIKSGIVKVPYDSTYYTSIVIDSIVKHDTTIFIYMPITQVIKIAHTSPTTHDTTIKKTTTTTFKTTHDTSIYSCKTFLWFFTSCKTRIRRTTHDTTTYKTIISTSKITHDTITYTARLDTIGYNVNMFQDTIVHDSIFKRTIFVHYPTYKDSIVYSDSFYVAPTSHDTTVHIFKIIWGLKIQQDNFSNQLNVAQQLGITAIRPNSIGIRDWNGDLGNVVDWHLNGIMPVININWIDDPSLKPYNFVLGLDTVIFKTNFDKICAALKIQVGTDMQIIIENEPTNEQYYNWDSANYVHELAMAIPIAHKYGLKIADGCIHLELVEMVRTNTMGRNKNAPKVKFLLSAFKNLNLDYVDTHCSYENNTFPVPNIKTTVDYIRSQTGKQVICNEYHMVGANATVVNWFISQWKAAQVPIVNPWSGDGTKSDAYNIGTTITQNIGVPYQQGIK